MIEPVHVGELIPEAMRDIERRIVDRRRLDAISEEIDLAQARISKLHHELGPVVERETLGVPQGRLEVPK